MAVNLAVASVPSGDRRVRRSRAALLGAAVRLVTERGTTELSVSELAEAADVSRQLVYLQFSDRDELLVQAALELVRRELVPLLEGQAPEAGSARSARAHALAAAEHFARHRRFYRPMLTGACAHRLDAALAGLFGPLNHELARLLLGRRPDRRLLEDLGTFLTGGAAALVNGWVVDGEEPLDPERFTDRLLRLLALLLEGAPRSPPAPPPTARTGRPAIGTAARATPRRRRQPRGPVR